MFSFSVRDSWTHVQCLCKHSRINFHACVRLSICSGSFRISGGASPRTRNSGASRNPLGAAPTIWGQTVPWRMRRHWRRRHGDREQMTDNSRTNSSSQNSSPGAYPALAAQILSSIAGMIQELYIQSA
jgi:hypothetical protein